MAEPTYRVCESRLIVIKVQLAVIEAFEVIEELPLDHLAEFCRTRLIFALSRVNW